MRMFELWQTEAGVRGYGCESWFQSVQERETAREGGREGKDGGTEGGRKGGWQCVYLVVASRSSLAFLGRHIQHIIDLQISVIS